MRYSWKCCIYLTHGNSNGQSISNRLHQFPSCLYRSVVLSGLGAILCDPIPWGPITTPEGYHVYWEWIYIVWHDKFQAAIMTLTRGGKITISDKTIDWQGDLRKKGKKSQIILHGCMYVWYRKDRLWRRSIASWPKWPQGLISALQTLYVANIPITMVTFLSIYIGNE